MFFELSLKTCNEGDSKSFLISVLWVSIFPLNIQPKYFPITSSSLLGPKCKESPSIFASPVLKGRGRHRSWCLKAFPELSLQAGTQQHDGIRGGCWTRQFQWEVARCPLEQRNRTNGASELPKLPFSGDSGYVLGLNVSQGLCQQMLVHQNSQWAGEISRSYSFIWGAQAAQFLLSLGILQPTMAPSRTLPVNSGFLCIFGPMPMVFNV